MATIRKANPIKPGELVELIAPTALYPWQHAILARLDEMKEGGVLREHPRAVGRPQRRSVFNVNAGQQLTLQAPSPLPQYKIWIDEAGIVNAATATQLHIGIDWGRDPEPSIISNTCSTERTKGDGDA